MGTREGKRGPCEAIPGQLSTDMDNQKLWDVAERLQRLIVSHDRAVQQMYLLGKEISKLDDLGVYDNFRFKISISLDLFLRKSKYSCVRNYMMLEFVLF